MINQALGHSGEILVSIYELLWHMGQRIAVQVPEIAPV